MYNLTSILLYLIIVSLTVSLNCLNEDSFCYKDEPECENTRTSHPTRYLFYDVNPSEGFNLRRDVYRRFAVLARQLASSSNPKLKNFKLVLPPWSHLYHWTYSNQPELIPWGYYFDLESLRYFAPVIEMYQFFEEQQNNKNHILIDEVYVMKNFEEMFRSGQFVNRMEVNDCEDEEPISYFYYTNVSSNNVKCLKFHGPSTDLTKILLKSSGNTIMFAHAETTLHPTFGDQNYWSARRSLRYCKELIGVANKFRRTLSSTDEADNIHLEKRWIDDKPRRDAIGGPYLAVHMRRRDFFIGRPKELPTLESVAKQIQHHLDKLGLSVVFLSTDAPPTEVDVLRYYLPERVLLVKFIPDTRFKDHYKDGGSAIIDQLVCAHARFFIGTAESTFTFRIFEEREILGFPTETTYNVLCANETNCKKPSVWKIVYGKD